MRIIAGEWRGRQIVPGAGLRPTGDRVREALFNILGGRIEGTFADLYAGTGAVGLEARSRGAVVVLVERAEESLVALRKNVQSLGASEGVLVVEGDALRFLKRPEGVLAQGPADVVFADPPYDYPAHAKLVRTLAASSVVGQDTLVVLEHRRGRAPWGRLPDALVLARQETYGDTVLAFVRRASSAVRADPMEASASGSPSTSKADESA